MHYNSRLNVFADIIECLCSKVIIQLILTNLVTVLMQWDCIILEIRAPEGIGNQMPKLMFGIKQRDILTVKFHSVAEHLLRYYNRNNKLITIICNLHITTKQLCKALNVPRLVLSNHCTKLGCSRRASTKRENQQLGFRGGFPEMQKSKWERLGILWLRKWGR